MNVPAFLTGYPGHVTREKFKRIRARRGGRKPGDRHMLIVDVMVALHPVERATVAKIAEDADCSEASVRRWLDFLIEKGIVIEAGTLPRPKHRRQGRGLMTYALHPMWKGPAV